jgi:hypothetical protein
MADEMRERLLASYGDMGEAMVVQTVLEAGGVPCRIADLADLPRHMFGILGAMDRSVGLWVLEADVERATALLGTMETTESGVDEEALAAEALTAAAPAGAGPQEPLASRSRRTWEARHAPGIWRVALVVAVSAVAVLLAARGCA